MTKKQIKAELQRLITKWKKEGVQYSIASIDPFYADRDRARYEGEGIAMNLCQTDLRNLLARL